MMPGVDGWAVLEELKENSLRRIGRRLGLEGTKELLASVRQGVLTKR